jgi:hypothetical protein
MEQHKVVEYRLFHLVTDMKESGGTTKEMGKALTDGLVA